MAHDVFISHSSKDKVMADAICAGLEARGIRCWIAPRDVQPGQNYAGQLYKAIEKCKVFLVVLTGNSLLSTHILKEVELAVQSGNAILPFRVQDVPLTDDLKYYLGNVHWLDALTPPVEKHIGILVEYIKRILDAQAAKAGLPVEEQGRPASSTDPVETSPKVAFPVEKKKTKNLVLLAGLGLLAVGFVIGGIILGNKLAGKTEPTSIVLPPTETFTLETSATMTVRPATPSPKPTITKTPGTINAVLSKSAYCRNSTDDLSCSVVTLLKGDSVKILARNEEWTWVLVENEKEDCWVNLGNFHLNILELNLPVSIPGPPTIQVWYGRAIVTNPDGSHYEDGCSDLDRDKTKVEQNCLGACDPYIAAGKDCIIAFSAFCNVR
jgi:hypothetical protein